MNDLISRISLKQSIVASAVLKDKKTLEQIIDEEPSVDAVHIVRCKNCEHYEYGKNYFGNTYRFCYQWNTNTEEDGWCFRADMKEEE